MANYSTSEFRSGLKIMLDGDPCSILENEFVKPGKGQAFNRVKMRNLKTGRVLEKTFKSGDSLEGADVIDTDMQYLYADGDFWYFMEPDTYEQHQATEAAVGDGSWGTLPSPDATLGANWLAVAAAGGVDGSGVYSAESYDAMALIILASQAAGSTDRAAIQAQVLNVANAPGIPCAAGDLATCLKYISGGLVVDYVLSLIHI